jgi:hypothetical protein
MNQPDYVEVFRLTLPMDMKDFRNAFVYLEKKYKQLGYDKFYMKGHYDEYGRNYAIFIASVFPPLQTRDKDDNDLRIEFTTQNERP